jgi:hypothetical protein
MHQALSLTTTPVALTERRSGARDEGTVIRRDGKSDNQADPDFVHNVADLTVAEPVGAALGRRRCRHRAEHRSIRRRDLGPVQMRVIASPSPLVCMIS